jgi:hypothetical protein
MAFSGQTTNTIQNARLAPEDVSELAIPLIPKEAPLLAFLGGLNRVPVRNIVHEYVEDFMLPNYITTSTAVNSATAATGITINGLGAALTVGTILENESTTPERLQISSIAGANSILVTRNYDGAGIGSLAVGQTLRVLAHAGIEGEDHSGSHTTRLGARKANTVGYYKLEFAASGSQLAQPVYGDNAYEDAIAKGIVQGLWMTENEIIAGVLNASNSLGTATATRTMRGIRSHISTVNSTVVAASFANNPHLYIGNVLQSAYDNGASPTETWALLAGATWYRDISNLNDTKVQDSNERETFKRVIRQYTGPLGSAEVILSRALRATELILVPRERVRTGTFRNWQRISTAQVGDNVKDLLVGEFTLEVHHEAAIPRLRA